MPPIGEFTWAASPARIARPLRKVAATRWRVVKGRAPLISVGGAHPENVDIPASVINGDGDQIVPIADSAILSSKLIRKNRH
jgi:hypothetical protein